MKNLSFLYTVAILLLLSSCGVDVPCVNAYEYFVWFQPGSITDTIPDTVVIATPYQKGSNFQTASDSSRQGGLYTDKTRQKMLQLKALRPDCYLFDWKIVLPISGRTYLLKDMTHYAMALHRGTMTEPTCYNDLGVYVNDSFAKYEGNPIVMMYIHY